MITARAQKNRLTALTYFQEHFSAGVAPATPSEWIGSGATHLGLTGPVGAEEFSRLCEARHPTKGQRLGERDRSVNRRLYFDFVFSPPKSVSIVALTAGDHRVQELHVKAVKNAFQRMETYACARVRKEGQNFDRATGNLTAAFFHHETSRGMNDPQLHTHAVVQNITWDQAENTWKALQPGLIYQNLSYLTEVYRSHLARGLMELGYRLRTTPQGFEIEGISEDLLARFSKRHTEMEKVARKLSSEKPGVKLSRWILARATRPKKGRSLSADEINGKQRAQINQSEWAALREVVKQAKSGRSSFGPGATPAEALDYARDHLFERASTVRREELLREALRFGRGHLVDKDLLGPLQARPEFIRREDQLTTREMLQLEREMISSVNRARERYRAFVSAPRLPPDLLPGQKAAVESLLRSTDGVMSLTGRAGTGKTHVVKTFVDALAATGQSVVIAAPTSGAVDVLKEGGFPEAQTLQRLLMDQSTHPKLSGRLLIVDEANLLSVRQMHSLLGLARSQGCRTLLIGDTRQHHSVEAGDALRILEAESRLRSATLEEILRQKSSEYRAAVKEIASGQTLPGYERLDRLGAVIEEPDRTRREKLLAAEYVQSRQKGRSALLVAPTWREIGSITQAVRQELKVKGLLSPGDKSVTVHDGLDWTEAQRRDFRRYRPGLILRFHHRTRDFAPGDWGKVVEVGKENLTIQRADSVRVKITGKQAKAFDVAECKTIDVAPDEQILIQANCRARKLINGQLVTVARVFRNGGLMLTDGRYLGPGFRSFTYGYAVTSHAAEGKTVDDVYLSASNASLIAASQEQFYVSVSRGRRKVRIFTESRSELLGAIQQSSMRTPALELVRPSRSSQIQKNYVAPRFSVS